MKAEFNRQYSHENYNIRFDQYMETIYLKAYKQKVQRVTYQTAMPHHKIMMERFGSRELRTIGRRDCELFRLWLIETYSPNYARGVWARFKACIGYAERLGYINDFPCAGLGNPRGKHP